ncbi:MAG: type VI secretion system membrane subunit TssM [Gammaproteobacteria bacterium]|nr:type VI secretion system membrane subunit TssM [Gammaproteobacteria bacterium]MBU1482076.1 type VI secretion system membrane subunit TssM [Gammaproteobacteria bacterium]
MIGSPQGIMFSLLSRMVSGARNFILSRGGAIFGGILLAVLMIWFLGPQIGLQSAAARIQFMAILALLVVIALLVKYWGDPRLARILNGIRNFLVSRGGIIFFGLLLLVLLIWFAGPLVGLKSVSARVWILAILASIIVITLLVKWSIDRRRGKKLEQDIEESAFLGTRPDRESEIALLRKQMHDAIGALKSSELVSTRRGSAALYALPWYMVIGPSAVGKSSILRNSNLNFPYSKHDPRGIQGVGGTRNCDWWFSDQAIFLDTAGRYTTEEDDHEEWFAFLEMLRTNRSKQPINGVVVAVNIADLLTSDSAAILENAKIVRDRIDELVIKLGIVFPVYLIFTKSDLIKGFASYFDDLSEKEREQVWGASMLALEQSDDREVGEIFEAEFDALHARLCAHRMLKMSLQRNLELKTEIMDMPNQFRAAGPRLAEFVHQVFKKSPYKETPIFGGFFFTSAAQEGTPIQLLDGTEMQAFGAVPDAVSQGGEKGQKPYFIHSLLREVVLPNSKQVVRNRRMTIRARFLKRFSIVMAIVIAVAGFMMLSSAYQNQLLLIADVKDSSKGIVRNVNGGKANMNAALQSVYSYYNTTGELWDSDDGGGFLTPGGLQEPLGQNFLLGMQTVFLAPVAEMLEEDLNNYSRNITPPVDANALSADTALDTSAEAELDPASQRSRRTAAAYDELKLYLYLSSPDVVEPTTFIDTFTSIWIAELRKNGVKVKELDRGVLTKMLTYYVKHMRDPERSPLHAQAWTSDKTLISNVRVVINQQPISERLYAEMRDVGSRKLEPLDLLSLVNGAPRGALVSKNSIPGIYTRNGWDTFVWPYLQKTIDESLRTDWVLGSSSAIDEMPTGEMRAQLVRQIRQLYFADYTNQWFSMLSSISARRFDSLHDASSQLQSFTSDNSAIMELLKSIHNNVAMTNIEELKLPFKNLTQITQEAIAGKENNWFDGYRKSLVAVQKDISRLSSSSDVPRDTRLFAVKLLNGDVDSELYRSWLVTNRVLEDVDARTAQSVANLLRAPIRNVWGTIISVSQKNLQLTWKDKTLFAFNETLRNNYPFATDGRDASMSDVADFFKPAGGLFWLFVNDEMGPFVERKGNKWEARKWLGIGLDFNPEFPLAIERSYGITNGMFKRGESNPGIVFSAYPFPNATLMESVIGIDGTEYRYRNGPQEWMNFTWPGQNPGGRVRGVRVGNQAGGDLVTDGTWALFRLLERAHISSNQGDSFVASWSMLDSNGQRLNISYKIRPDRSAALFQPGVLQGYRLPAEIFLRPATGDRQIE